MPFHGYSAILGMTGGGFVFDLGKYRENNRIEAKKATGGLPESF